MTGLRGGICENNFSDQGVIRYCRGVLFRGDRGGQAAKDDQQEFERMSGISSEVLRVSLGVYPSTLGTCCPPRTAGSPSVCKRLRKSTCTVPRAPVLVQVLESGEVLRLREHGRVQGHPFSCKYLRAGKCPFGCGARVCTPIKVVHSRPLQQSYTPPASSVVHIRVSQLAPRSPTTLS